MLSTEVVGTGSLSIGLARHGNETELGRGAKNRHTAMLTDRGAGDPPSRYAGK